MKVKIVRRTGYITSQVSEVNKAIDIADKEREK